MPFTIRESRVLVEVDGVSPDFLDEIHDFVRRSHFAPKGKVEITTNGGDKPRVGHYSGYFTPMQADTFREWLISKGVAPSVQ